MAEDFDVWSGRKLEQKKFAMWSDEKKAAAQRDLSSVGKMYGLHPGVGEVEKAAQSQAAVTTAKKPDTQTQTNTFTTKGQAERWGTEATPTKSFTFSQSPKGRNPGKPLFRGGCHPPRLAGQNRHGAHPIIGGHLF